MSRVLTFSRTFPSYHPKAGEPTYFVEKFWNSFSLEALDQEFYIDYTDEIKFDLNKNLPFGILDNFFLSLSGRYEIGKKNHTIRKGNRWKKGMYFSPAVWGNDVNPKSGKRGPYQSKQIKIGPDTEVKKTWSFDLIPHSHILIDGKFKINLDRPEELKIIADNDGLNAEDLLSWFKYPKPVIDHQIIYWNESIEY
jgi:hypothetical protein